MFGKSNKQTCGKPNHLWNRQSWSGRCTFMILQETYHKESFTIWFAFGPMWWRKQGKLLTAPSRTGTLLSLYRTQKKFQHTRQSGTYTRAITVNAAVGLTGAIKFVDTLGTEVFPSQRSPRAIGFQTLDRLATKEKPLLFSQVLMTAKGKQEITRAALMTCVLQFPAKSFGIMHITDTHSPSTSSSVNYKTQNVKLSGPSKTKVRKTTSGVCFCEKGKKEHKILRCFAHLFSPQDWKLLWTHVWCLSVCSQSMSPHSETQFNLAQWLFSLICNAKAPTETTETITNRNPVHCQQAHHVGIQIVVVGS